MSAKPYLPCSEIITFLAGYLDHELPATTLTEFERHLAVCASCRAYLQTYGETIRAIRGLTKYDEILPAEAPSDLIEAILNSRPK